MQVWYIIFAIASLLFIASIINSIAEAIERREREKMIEILRAKREVDNISEYLDNLKDFSLPKEIIRLLENEILVRLEKIKLLDARFEDINALIIGSKERLEIKSSESQADELQGDSFISEDNLMNRLSAVRQLTSYLQQMNFMSSESRIQQINYADILITFRFEKLNSFYTKQITKVLQDNDYELAINYTENIIHGIALSGHSNLRLSEITEQAMEVLNEIKIQQQQYQAELDEKQRLEEEAFQKQLAEEKKAAKKAAKRR